MIAIAKKRLQCCRISVKVHADASEIVAESNRSVIPRIQSPELTCVKPDCGELYIDAIDTIVINDVQSHFVPCSNSMEAVETCQIGRSYIPLLIVVSIYRRHERTGVLL